LVCFLERQGSAKGQKDKIDIIALLQLNNFNFELYKKILQKYNLENYQKELNNLVVDINELLELELNQYQYAKLKKRVLKYLK